MSAPAQHSVWCRVYRLSLQLLPAALREKHADAMVAMFARDLAKASGAWARLPIVVAALRDVFTRAPYEWVQGSRAGLATEAESSEASKPELRPLTLARQLIVPFAVSYAAFTALLIALYLQRARFDVSPVEQFVLSLPYMSVLTIPLALCIAATLVGRHTRRAAGDVIPRGLQRSMLIIASIVAAFTLLLASEIVPRANARLVDIRAGRAMPHGDRSMTITELRRASTTMQSRARQAVDGSTAHELRVLAVNFEVEIHKKLVFAVACLVLAFTGVALGWHFARMHASLLILGSVGVFIAFIVSLMAGESLSDRYVTSPIVAMWAGTELLLLMTLPALFPRRRRATARGLS